MRFNSREDDAIDSSHGDNNFVIRNGVLSTNISLRFDSSFLSIDTLNARFYASEMSEQIFEILLTKKEKRTGIETKYYFIRKFHRDIYIYILKIENEEKKKKGKKKILSSIFHETTFSILAIETEN